MTRSFGSTTASMLPFPSIVNDVKKAKEALWQYEVKSEAIMLDVFDSIGILENDLETRFDLHRTIQLAQQLKRYVDFIEFVNEVLEHMVMVPEAVKRFNELQQDRLLAQRAQAACSI